MSTRELVAGELRAYLARAQLSGRQAALKLGWTEMYMARRLRGQVPLDVDDLEALGELLELPVTAFFEAPAALSEASGRGSRNQHLDRHAWELAA